MDRERKETYVGDEMESKNFEKFKQIKDASKSPYVFAGRFELVFPGLSSIGSGVLIGERYVLTCGHNLFWKPKWEYRDYYDEPTAPYAINFYPGSASADDRPYEAKAAYFIVHPKYHPNFDPCYDLGLVVLDRPIGFITGWAGFAPKKAKELVGKDLRILGYPCEASGHNNRATRYLYESQGPAVGITGNIIKYHINTNRGNSG